MCACVLWYKEGQWRGSGIIWRGRCWNIVSWITALHTGEMDGRTTDRQREGGREEEEGGGAADRMRNQSRSSVLCKNPIRKSKNANWWDGLCGLKCTSLAEMLFSDSSA